MFQLFFHFVMFSGTRITQVEPAEQTSFGGICRLLFAFLAEFLLAFFLRFSQDNVDFLCEYITIIVRYQFVQTISSVNCCDVITFGTGHRLVLYNISYTVFTEVIPTLKYAWITVVSSTYLTILLLVRSGRHISAET